MKLNWRTVRMLLWPVVMVVLAACQPVPSGAPPLAPGTATPRPGGVLRYGLTLPVSGIDPHIHASSELGIALSNVYDTLVVQDEAGAFHPSLAERWEISPDNRTYTFYLRKDVRFHDGTPFNAAAVAATLAKIADPATKSQKAVYLLGPYDGTELPDEFTVRIRLTEPFAPLLDGLSQVYLGIASPAALAKWGDQYQLHQVGTGPFRFVSYQERQTLILERNPDYNWAPVLRGHAGAAYLDRVEFRFYADAATRLPALLAGQADVMGELPTRDAQQLETGSNSQRFRLHPVALPGQSVQFFMNTSLAPLDDLRVRQALLYLSGRAELVKAVFGEFSPVATGPLTAATRWALGPVESVAVYPFDRAKGQALLADAGWSDTDGDGILDKGGRPLVLKGVLMSWGELPSIGTILQSQWREAGVQLDLEQMSYPAALEAGRAGTHHLVPFSNAGTDPSLLRTFFHGDNIGAFNWSRVDEPAVNEALDTAHAAADPAIRGSLYLDVQRRAMEQAWVLPIRDSVNLNAASTRVQGLRYDVQGWNPVLYDVWLSE